MPVLSSAVASPRNLCTSVGQTTLTTVYTAPTYSTNVTAPSSTAYIKEISICNVSSAAVTVIIQVNNQPILSSMTINGNDTKILTGLNTMINSGQTIQVQASIASSIVFQISGVEVQ